MGKGIGGFVSSIFGSENKSTAKTPTLDPNAYQYGGAPGGAAEAANRYRGIGDRAQTRGGEQVNYEQAEWDRQQAYGARMGQQGMADQMAMRARGQLPSIAGMQADRQMQQATAAQASASASARGAGGMALAQQQAANNTANAHGAISGQAQINAANERMAAEQAAFGAYSGMRGGDQQQGQMAAQQQQFQSQLNAAQRAQNDQMTMGMTGFEVGVNNAQLGAQQNQQAQQSANALGASGINAGVGGQNAGTNQTNAMGVVGMVRDAGSAGMGAISGKAEGGATNQNQAYLVGEEGPELIVPRRDGHVMTAEETARVLAKAGGLAPKESHVRSAPVDWEVSDRLTALEERRREPTSFRSDSDSDRARVNRAYEDKAGREADALMASYAAQLGRGASVARSEGEIEDSPGWLDAYMQRQERPLIAFGGPREQGGIVQGSTNLGMPGVINAGYGTPGGPTSMAPVDQFKVGSDGKLGMDVLGSLKAHSDFATRFQRVGQAPPTEYGGARAEGGPIQGYAPSTWGTGGPDVAGQSMAMMRASTAADAARQAAVQAQSVESPWARDVRQVQALRRMNPELINDEDDTRERRGLAVMGQARKEEAAKPKDKPAEKKAEAAPPAEKKPDTIDRMQSQKPAEYHAMGGYVPPHLIPVPSVSYGGAREEGGPVSGSPTFAQRAKSAAKSGYEAMLFGAPTAAAIREVGAQYRSLTPDQRLTVLDEGAKLALGPISGRALIGMSQEAMPVTDEEVRKRREAQAAAAAAAKK